jgi:hypothetical protein
MFGWVTLHVAALLLVAALYGGMLMFMAVFTPLVFRSLPAAAAAGAFLRDVFPVYYRVCGILALLAALPLVPAHAYPAEIAALVAAAGFVLANRVLRPALNRAREEGRDPAFRRLHRLSVALHLAQFAAVAAVLIRLAQ